MPKLSAIPACPATPTPTPRHGFIKKEYTITLITPMCGGGVQTNHVDATHPFRETSIRGQLQFWWRATRGAPCPETNDLKIAHQKIWGATDHASKIKVWVSGPPPSLAPMELARYGDPRLYALFPVLIGDGGRDRRTIRTEIAATGKFTLNLQYPSDLAEDVDAALRAWINFGGLGMRTRRGCGALYCPELSAKNVDAVQGLAQGLGTGGPAHLWPTLPKSILCGAPAAPDAAWKNVIQLLQTFRQGEDVGRNPGRDGRAGRSRWPEPETIRRITNRRAASHPRLEDIPDDAFPRAEFGLPIIFHFKDDGEPRDTTLYPVANNMEVDRMASPLVLKPLAISESTAVPIVLRLNTPQLEQVRLCEREKVLDTAGNEQIRNPELAKYKKSPLAYSDTGSALDAFIAFCIKKWHPVTAPGRK